MADRLSVDLEGLDKLRFQFRMLPRRKRKQVANEVQTTAFEIITIAKRFVPVDEGVLKASLRILEVKAFRLGAELGSDVDYASFVEFNQPEGTGPNGGPRPYLRPAIAQERPGYLKRITTIMNQP